MNRGSLLLLACIVSSSAIAATAVPTGSFGLEFSANPKAAAYSIAGSGSAYQVTSVEDQTEYDATVMDDAAKKSFWEKQGLKSDSSSASCLRFERDVICDVPADVRKSDDKLKNISSDYFFYTPTADGIVSAFKL